MIRRATCSCGQLAADCEGEPVRISMCHCHACQRRTGSTYGVQARWPRECVTVTGTSTGYVRTGDSGGVARFQFCPSCGAIVSWTADDQPELIAIPVGAFADATFPPPTVSVYEERMPPWVCTPATASHEA